MTIYETPTPAHWNYFLALEDDVSTLARYLEPTQENFGAYSLELARILFSASSEVDVVAKQLCKRIDPTSRAENVMQYQSAIMASDPSIARSQVEIPKFGLTLHPWEGWDTPDHSPLWWRAYNNVKHKRHTNFHEASLKNALNSVAALFVLLLFFYEVEAHDGRLNPNPTLFRVSAPFSIDTDFFGNNEYRYRRT